MVWEIALVIFLLVMTVLVILLIPTVLQLFKTLQKLSKTLDEINNGLPEILENLEEITDSTSRASQRIDGAVNDVVEIQQKISAELKEPAMETIATIAGLLKGLQTFMTYFVKKRR